MSQYGYTSSCNTRQYGPIWDNELGQMFVARLVFGFVTRRIWFSRVEIKLFLSKTHGIYQLSVCRLLVLQHGPNPRQPGVVTLADYDPSVHTLKLQLSSLSSRHTLCSSSCRQAHPLERSSAMMMMNDHHRLHAAYGPGPAFTHSLFSPPHTALMRAV